MTNAAVESFVRIPRALAILSSHPNGLPLDSVASELGVGEEQLRDDILNYYAADIPADALMGLQRAESIEFLAADGAEDDPALAPIIRIVSERPQAELGLEYLRADQLAELYEAARSLSELEPRNAALSEAVEKLAATFLAGKPLDSGTRSVETAAALRTAMEEQRCVEIEYSRAWRPGVNERVVHPYAMHHSSRGWELDAGPLEDGRARTFIVDRIRSVATLTDRFQRPAGVDDLLRRERRETWVELNLPQGTHWVADRFAERTEVLAADADDLSIGAALLPPVMDRVGLILLIAGQDAFVMEPEEYVEAGDDLARRLLHHHGLTPQP